MNLKVSNIFERKNLFDSNAYSNLSPKYKAAVRDIFEDFEYRDESIRLGSVVKDFEEAVKKAAKAFDCDEYAIWEYLDEELDENLSLFNIKGRLDKVIEKRIGN